MTLYRLMDRIGDGLLRLIQFEKRFSKLFLLIHLKLIALDGSKATPETARRYCSRTFAGMLFSLALAITGGGLAGDQLLLSTGCSLTLFVPFIRYRNLDIRIRKRRMRILLDLPELLSKLTLMVSAGETVQRALKRCLERHETGSVLYNELDQVVRDLDHNQSFQASMESFSRRCGVQEISLFTNTILLNYNRGGDDFVTSLRELNRQLWQKRKSLAKTMGEEASSKMAFPMIVIFLVVTVVVAAPAVFMMDQI
ncbi:type II secretion system F family protein [Gorillibacterium massiliense]|uniref:type II secretion system F family protein n=1 Tax=Gorillibacterium massiliense TaxID=1280390 RepID=UPI0004B8D715|nr:type II secretion system F family protein [Gorillibacterium massiliense]